MTFLLDTNTCIYYLNQGHPEVTRRMVAAGPDRLAVSALTVAELHYGAERSGRPEANRERLRVFLGELRTVPFDDRCGESFGTMKVERRAAGRPVPDFDLAIAATAVAQGLTLVSSDQHMRSLPGIAVEDWTAAPAPERRQGA